ncbi:unnamed protein product [Brassica oleracea]|uniref:Uncharacterized protein n=1 Tax=Brassica oleracea TaxID=3712 RepID=A0A3P6G9M9_BRAOL|nr:unnamed protein product [Brassica oleracea]
MIANGNSVHPPYSLASTLSLMTLVHHTVTLRILFPASLLHVSFEFHVNIFTPP